MELIKISEKEGKKVVSARDLHAFLENTDNVNTWFKRQADRAMLVENEDFVSVAILQTSGQTSIDYAISVSSAKEIAMLNGGDKGKQARLYFIECEKQLQLQTPNFNNPAIAARAWADEYEKRQLAESKVNELKPKADVYDKINSAENLMSIEQAAKIINLKGIGRNNFFKLLREDGILMKNNLPYQELINRGLFEVKVIPVKMGNSINDVTQTYVTANGLIFLTEKIYNYLIVYFKNITIFVPVNHHLQKDTG